MGRSGGEERGGGAGGKERRGSGGGERRGGSGGSGGFWLCHDEIYLIYSS